jgi:hypothetical protein
MRIGRPSARIVLAALLTAALGGCVFSRSYWFSAEQLGPDTFRVNQRSENSPDKRAPELDAYILKKCAKLALEKGYARFKILDWKVEHKFNSANPMIRGDLNSETDRDILTIQLFKEAATDGAYDAEAVADGEPQQVPPH